MLVSILRIYVQMPCFLLVCANSQVIYSPSRFFCQKGQMRIHQYSLHKALYSCNIALIFHIVQQSFAMYCQQCKTNTVIIWLRANKHGHFGICLICVYYFTIILKEQKQAGWMPTLNWPQVLAFLAPRYSQSFITLHLLYKKSNCFRKDLTSYGQTMMGLLLL